MKTLLAMLVAVMFLVSGCASLNTASVYSNQSTPGKTQVNAQGTAAKHAAANQQFQPMPATFNCTTCTQEQIQQMYNHQMYLQKMAMYGNAKAPRTAFDAQAKNDLAKTFNWRMDRALDQFMWKLLQDYN
jgi:PBP1b-binding outer membrane lipoprotein LpoB